MGQLDDAIARRAAEDEESRRRRVADEERLQDLCADFVQKAAQLGLPPADLLVAESHKKFFGGTKSSWQAWGRGWVVDPGQPYVFDYGAEPSQIITTDGRYFLGTNQKDQSTYGYRGELPKPGGALDAVVNHLEAKLVSFVTRNS